MATIDELGLVGQKRDRPINDRLRRVLLAAAEDAGVDVVFIGSGGQPGSSGQRTGSHRHDGGNAADLDLIRNGRKLKFTDLRDLAIFKSFVTSAAARGATGIGAAEGYMGTSRIDVGFGNGPNDTTKVVWGAGGASANAPGWLRDAARRGWAEPIDIDAEIGGEHEAEHFFEGELMTDDSEIERFRPLLDFIADAEGTANQPDDGYNTSLGYGRYLPGKKEIDLTSKSLDEIYQIGLGMRQRPGNPDLSALGRYQITGQTLRDFQARRGLPGTTKFSPEIQDRLACDIILVSGRNARKLMGRWAGLKSRSENAILAAYDTRGAGRKGTIMGGLGQSDVAALAALLRKLGIGGSAAASSGDWPILQQGVNNEEAIKRLQGMLNDLRYYTGGPDGKFGPITRGAVALFQLDNGLEVTGTADEATWAALTRGSPRPLPDPRREVTADDMRKLGSQTVWNADLTRYAGWIAGALGLGGLGKSGACTLEPTRSAAFCGAAPTSTAAPGPGSWALQNVQDIEAWKKALATAANDPKVLEALHGRAPEVQQALDLVSQLLPFFSQSLQKAAPIAQQVAAQTDSSWLISALGSGLAGLLPGGFAGSLAAIGLGVAVNIFGNRIITRRVSDQREGRNIGARTS